MVLSPSFSLHTQGFSDPSDDVSRFPGQLGWPWHSRHSAEPKTKAASAWHSPGLLSQGGAACSGGPCSSRAGSPAPTPPRATTLRSNLARRGETGRRSLPSHSPSGFLSQQGEGWSRAGLGRAIRKSTEIQRECGFEEKAEDQVPPNSLASQGKEIPCEDQKSNLESSLNTN